MLEKYERLIYQTDAEKEEAQNSYTDYFDKEWSEGKKLFELAALKFGKPLWEGAAWKDDNCRKKCPYGDGCENDKIIIDDKAYCLGQIYLYKFTLTDVLEAIKKSKSAFVFNGYHNETIPLCGDNEYAIEAGMEYLKEDIFGFYGNYTGKTKIQRFFSSYGDNNGSKIIGENVISLLEQDLK